MQSAFRSVWFCLRNNRTRVAGAKRAKVAGGGDRPYGQEVKSQKGQRPLQGLGLINSARHTKSLENFFLSPFGWLSAYFLH